ncbi:drebrin-like protein B isoform X2 [Ictalurus punctatus]|uniref:Drebrin-like protein B isoform X2 n=1 Tax=Ictalurus punctatus TaxID=7998 RepID=A0A9F7RM86_ICTPU|nr:drebrin-like protein B isoform X2 [Ictalurus punctatus]
MAVNLSKHGAALSDAYNEVVNGRTDTDWVLFTYEGNSYDIQVAAKGGGGLDQMVQELNAGKVMYAFCRVTDPNSGVPKFILINWTGEGVAGVRRGVCANHFNSMAHFLRGAHVMINAHSEDDVEPELIMNKVSQAVGVTYSLHTESNEFNSTSASRPVGSTYRKTNALEEIKGTNRDNFWAQLEKEEQTRRQQERKKAEEERQRVEKERKEQEERETAERERQLRERAKQINQQRLFEKRQETEHQNQQRREPVEQELRSAEWKGIRSSRSVQEANKEEQTRRQQEQKKAEEERQKVEKERIEQEERDTAERERQLRERAKQIDQQRLFEKRQETEHQNQQRREPVEQELRSAEWKGIRSSRSVQEANGSKYYKTSALEEINGTDRENFWAQLEKEEQTHRQQERKKAEEERQRVEKERKEQEERETAERERQLRERAKQINQQRLQEKKQEAKNINQQKSVEQELQAAQWKGIRSSRSVQEANDAAAIISQRAVNPRDIFSQKETNFLTNRASETQPACNGEGTLEENIYDVPSHHRVYDEVKDDRMSTVKQSAGLQQSLYAKALYDYQAADETEITFDPGDIITVVEMTDEGWWHGYGPGGHYGMFPSNYVELI